eukprot:800234-Rhodomonas_salina.2
MEGLIWKYHCNRGHPPAIALFGVPVPRLRKAHVGVNDSLVRLNCHCTTSSSSSTTAAGNSSRKIFCLYPGTRVRRFFDTP